MKKETTGHKIKNLKTNFKKYHKKMQRRGVCYFSEIPKSFNVHKIKLFFEMYKVERIYLVPRKTKKLNSSKDKKMRI